MTSARDGMIIAYRNVFSHAHAHMSQLKQARALYEDDPNNPNILIIDAKIAAYEHEAEFASGQLDEIERYGQTTQHQPDVEFEVMSMGDFVNGVMRGRFGL